jgi:hypothetical protein
MHAGRLLILEQLCCSAMPTMLRALGALSSLAISSCETSEAFSSPPASAIPVEHPSSSAPRTSEPSVV